MSQPSLWARIRQARVFQVFAVYLGTSWLVIQIADTLVDAFRLPDWVVPATVILLLAGMVVILATAWVQSLPATTAREQTGELPGDWQIALGDAWSSLRRGRLPHLTWGRSIAGGVIVLVLLFGGAGVYMAVTGERLGLGPAPASASEAAVGIAVVPFEVRGQDLEIWREGMMDLLANGLDGVGGFRTIDTRTVMARWNSVAGDDGAADLADAFNVARAVGARYALEGSVVGLGANVRLVANIYDLETEKSVASSRVEGPAADVLRLADELAVGVMRGLLREVGRGGAGDAWAETITTSSLPAMTAYLEGETHYREGRFPEAVASYERAVAEDSTFAIALVRLSDAYGWLESANSERMHDALTRALAQAHRLSPRYQAITRGWAGLNDGTTEGLPELKVAVQTYPDDPTAWYLLGEMYLHIGGATYRTDEEMWHALQQATKLDPNFAPYLVHIAENHVLRGDRAGAEAALERYEELTGGLTQLAHIQLAIPLLLGSDAEAAAVLDTAGTITQRTFQYYNGTFGRRHERFDRDAAIDSAYKSAKGIDPGAYPSYYLGSMGQLQRAATAAAAPGVTPAARAVYWAHVSELWDVQPPDPALLSLAACNDPAFLAFCHEYAGLANARMGRWNESRAFADALRQRATAFPDSQNASYWAAAADVLEAAATWRRGDLRTGREALTRHAGTAGSAGESARIELAWLEAEAGRASEALRHFRSVQDGFRRPIALYGMARMSEELGQPDEARRYWTRFNTLTAQGDDVPRIVEARRALAGRTGDAAAR